MFTINNHKETFRIQALVMHMH